MAIETRKGSINHHRADFSGFTAVSKSFSVTLRIALHLLNEMRISRAPMTHLGPGTISPSLLWETL